MKKQIFKATQPIILFLILLLLTIWNAFNADLSVDMVYWMLIVSAVLTIFHNHSGTKGGQYVVHMIHLVIFLYLAWAFLVIGGSMANTVLDYVFYILLLVSVWFGLGYTALMIKQLMKL